MPDTIPMINYSPGAGGLTLDLAKYIGGNKSTETGNTDSVTSTTGDTAALQQILGQLMDPANLQNLVNSLFNNAARQVPTLTSQYANATGTRVNNNTMLGSSLAQLNESLAQAIAQAITKNQETAASVAGKIADVNKTQSTNQNTSGRKETAPGDLGKAVGTGLAVTGGGFLLNRFGDKALKRLGLGEDAATSPASVPSSIALNPDVSTGSPGFSDGFGNDSPISADTFVPSSVDDANMAFGSDPSGIVISPIADPTQIDNTVLSPGGDSLASVGTGLDTGIDAGATNGIDQVLDNYDYEDDVASSIFDDIGFADGGRVGRRPVRGYADGGSLQISDPTFRRKDKFGVGSSVRGAALDGTRFMSDAGMQMPHIVINVGTPTSTDTGGKGREGDLGRTSNDLAGTDTTTFADHSGDEVIGNSEDSGISEEEQIDDANNRDELEAGDTPTERDPETGLFPDTNSETHPSGGDEGLDQSDSNNFGGKPSILSGIAGFAVGGIPGLLFNLARSALVSDVVKEVTDPHEEDITQHSSQEEDATNDPLEGWWGNSTTYDNANPGDNNTPGGEDTESTDSSSENIESADSSEIDASGSGNNHGIPPGEINEFADGGETKGIVKGKKVGPAVDNILIAAQPDEYVLPTDVVKYIGKDVLDDLVASIHTPVKTGTHD